MKILILGANGFIGSHLCEKILADRKSWEIFALDLSNTNLDNCLGEKNFHFLQGDMTQEKKWIESKIQECDVVLPLVAIATPALYVQDPLRVFELDFEANLEIIKLCVNYKKHIVFPSTSEVYGMCSDAEFREEESNLVTGPINKERWIYSTSKQLLDRVIYANGKHRGLSYTLFRPFNWYGPRQDNVFNPKPGGSRVLTQFIGNILRAENITLVDGGKQQRCFTYISDGIDAIVRILDTKDSYARNHIFNVGNPYENISIRQLAEILLQYIRSDYAAYKKQADKVELIEVDAKTYYGAGYQDVALRVPAIQKARESLNWQPTVNIKMGLKKTLDFYLLEPKEEVLPAARRGT